jgi:dimethylhistidine N-methyltransferase
MLTQAIRAVRETDFGADVRLGLTKAGQKELPSKYLYDEVGSALFEAICVLPEYGLCRAGIRLMKRYAREMVERLHSPAIVAELGSGSGKKTRYILEALSRRQRTTYYPIDISAAALAQCARELSHIDSVSVVGFERAYLDGLLEVAARRKEHEQILVLFLGSTIGNFDRPAGNEFLRQVRAILRPGDSLLLATDLVKPVRQLLDAYDDPVGITASFNLNLLARINRELDSNFELSRFAHLARWDDEEHRIEMHLVSRKDQEVNIPGARIRVRLRAEETIWTESSHKYTTEEVVEMADRTGFHCEAQWVDQDWPFAQSLFQAV